MRVLWYHEPHGRYRHGGWVLVRILDTRKHTARIEYRRSDGSFKRRFVKLSRLMLD